jgi:hypothetical protein
MIEENDHRACVEAWMVRAARDLPPERLIQAFEQGFGALWQRALQTLGDVTLTAIADRVIFNAAERYPVFAGLRSEMTALQWQELRDSVGSTQRDDVAAGIRFVLVEFLTVLGNLTANILSPSLHTELANLVFDNGSPDAKNRPPQRSNAVRKSENAKS